MPGFIPGARRTELSGAEPQDESDELRVRSVNSASLVPALGAPSLAALALVEPALVAALVIRFAAVFLVVVAISSVSDVAAAGGIAAAVGPNIAAVPANSRHIQSRVIAKSNACERCHR